jgi:hypothetical protein
MAWILHEKPNILDSLFWMLKNKNLIEKINAKIKEFKNSWKKIKNGLYKNSFSLVIVS